MTLYLTIGFLDFKMWLTPIWFSQCDLKSQNVTLYLIIWVGCLIWLYISKCDIIFYNFILRSPNVTFPNLTFSQCDVKSHVTLYLKIWLIFINQNMTLPPNLTLYLTVWRYIFQWLFHFKPFLTIKVTLWHTDTVRSFFFFLYSEAETGIHIWSAARVGRVCWMLR